MVWTKDRVISDRMNKGMDWIKTSERMPEPDVRVLLWIRKGWTVGYRVGSGKTFYDILNGREIEEVEYWALPSAPAE